VTNNSQLPPVPKQRPRAACVFVLDADGRVLAVTIDDDAADDAATNPGAYEWGLPGGSCEDHERPEDAAVRECFEETGYVIAGLHPVHVQAQCGCVSYGFVAHIVAAEVTAPRRAPGEGVAAWVDPELLLRGKYAAFNRAVQAKVLG